VRHYDHPDANAAPIWEYLERVGCKLLQVEGCDRLVLIPGGAMVLIEVKNPNGKARAKGGGWAYTKSERALMDWCAENGHDYMTVTSIEEMQTIVRNFKAWEAA
jgi:hypothetical protein